MHHDGIDPDLLLNPGVWAARTEREVRDVWDDAVAGRYPILLKPRLSLWLERGRVVFKITYNGFEGYDIEAFLREFGAALEFRLGWHLSHDEVQWLKPWGESPSVAGSLHPPEPKPSVPRPGRDPGPTPQPVPPSPYPSIGNDPARRLKASVRREWDEWVQQQDFRRKFKEVAERCGIKGPFTLDLVFSAPELSGNPRAVYDVRAIIPDAIAAREKAYLRGLADEAVREVAAFKRNYPTVTLTAKKLKPNEGLALGPIPGKEITIYQLTLDFSTP